MLTECVARHGWRQLIVSMAKCIQLKGSPNVDASTINENQLPKVVLRAALLLHFIYVSEKWMESFSVGQKYAIFRVAVWVNLLRDDKSITIILE